MEVTCRICYAKSNKKFEATVKDSYLAEYYQCSECFYLFIKNPIWLSEQYSDSLGSQDTGFLQRNIVFARSLRFLLPLIVPYSLKNQFLDYAGGFGTLTRLMRDYGYNFFSYDPFCKPIISPYHNHSSIEHQYTAITLFEVVEHIENPFKLIKQLLMHTNILIFNAIDT